MGTEEWHADIRRCGRREVESSSFVLQGADWALGYGSRAMEALFMRGRASPLAGTASIAIASTDKTIVDRTLRIPLQRRDEFAPCRLSGETHSVRLKMPCYRKRVKSERSPIPGVDASASIAEINEMRPFIHTPAVCSRRSIHTNSTHLRTRVNGCAGLLSFGAILPPYFCIAAPLEQSETCLSMETHGGFKGMPV